MDVQVTTALVVVEVRCLCLKFYKAEQTYIESGGGRRRDDRRSGGARAGRDVYSDEDDESEELELGGQGGGREVHSDENDESEELELGKRGGGRDRRHTTTGRRSSGGGREGGGREGGRRDRYWVTRNGGLAREYGKVELHACIVTANEIETTQDRQY